MCVEKDEHGGAAPKSLVIAEAMVQGISTDQAERLISDLLRDGGLLVDERGLHVL